MASLYGDFRNAVRTGPGPNVPPLANRISNYFPGSRHATTTELQTTGTVGTIYAIVDAIVQEMVRANMCINQPGPKGEPVEVTNHAALTVMQKPNRFYTWSKLLATSTQHLETTGELWWVYATTSQGVPYEIWPVRPDRMAPVLHPTEFITGYVYTSPDGEQIPLGLNQVTYGWHPGPIDMHRGMSVIQSILTDIDSVRFASLWNRNFFQNSAQPSGTLEVPTAITDDQFKKLQIQWNESHRGVNNAGRVGILEAGMKFTPMPNTRQDMQFVELRASDREVLREAFRISKTVLGLTEDVNRATAEAARLVFLTSLIEPRAKWLSELLTNDFLPRFGSTTVGMTVRLEVDIPEDDAAENAERESKATTFKTYIDSGLEPQQAAELADLDIAPIMASQATSAPAVPHVMPVDAFMRHPHPLPLMADNVPGGAGDLQPLQDDWQRRLDEFLNQFEDLTHHTVQEAFRSVEHAATTTDVTDVYIPDPETSDLEDALVAALIAAAAAAAQFMVTESKDQGVTIPAGLVRETTLRDTAKLVTRGINRDIITSITRSYTRYSGFESVTKIMDNVKAAWSGVTLARPEQYIGGALTQAQHQGRIATIDTVAKQMPELARTGNVYASEKLDSNTCTPCREIDGKHLGTVYDASIANNYPNGGYYKCLGRERCRGQVVIKWELG